MGWGLVSDTLALSVGGAMGSGEALLPATRAVEAGPFSDGMSGIDSASGASAESAATAGWGVPCRGSVAVDEVSGPAVALFAWAGAPVERGTKARTVGAPPALSERIRV